MKLKNKESDLRIWQNFRNGNRVAFQKIYFDNYRILYNYCRKYTNDTSLVEDIIQDLFITLLERKEYLSDTDNIRFYLFSSIRRRLFKALNAKEFKVTDLFDNDNPAFHLDQSVEPNYGNDDDENRFQNLLINSLNSLGERQKEIVYLKYYTGLNSKEIANMLGVTNQTVRNTLCTALVKLRKDFDNEIPQGRMVIL